MYPIPFQTCIAAEQLTATAVNGDERHDEHHDFLDFTEGAFRDSSNEFIIATCCDFLP